MSVDLRRGLSVCVRGAATLPLSVSWFEALRTLEKNVKRRGWSGRPTSNPKNQCEEVGAGRSPQLRFDQASEF